jgi:hypothetical protein
LTQALTILSDRLGRTVSGRDEACKDFYVYYKKVLVRLNPTIRCALRPPLRLAVCLDGCEDIVFVANSYIVGHFERGDYVSALIVWQNWWLLVVVFS